MLRICHLFKKHYNT